MSITQCNCHFDISGIKDGDTEAEILKLADFGWQLPSKIIWMHTFNDKPSN